MIALIQRVQKASVSLKSDPSQSHSIKAGLCILLGIAQDDQVTDADKLAAKIAKLRIFADGENKMNLDITQADGQILLISQFTLISNCRKGNRPSFASAAPPDRARSLYEHLASKLKEDKLGLKTGFFGQYMLLELVNDGPVTIILDSTKL